MNRKLHVVVAGGGVAALEAVLALRDLAQDLVEIELVAPEAVFEYRPLSVVEPFRVGEMRKFPLRRLAEAAGAELRHGTVAAVDAEQKTVKLADDREVAYDTLLLALGARPRQAVAGAATFAGPHDEDSLAHLLERVVEGEIRRIVFAIPAGTSWSLPAYELALLTAEYVADHGARGVEVALATREDRPLELFGPAASNAIAELLEIRGVGLHTGVAPLRWEAGALQLAGREPIEADAVIALPRLEGPGIPGIPADGNGFVPTDELGWVLGLVDVYAAGDVTQFPLKQGGIAAQQADAAATAIASDAGATVRPTPLRPVLRGLLLTGRSPRYLRAELRPESSQVDTEPLWWPPAKIVGRYLAPFLAQQLGIEEEPPPPHREPLPVEVELDATGRPAWTPV